MKVGELVTLLRENAFPFADFEVQMITEPDTLNRYEVKRVRIYPDHAMVAIEIEPTPFLSVENCSQDSEGTVGYEEWDALIGDENA